MTAAGDAVLAVAYSQVGRTEDPPNSNLCSPYTDAWGPGAWCAMFVSWCCEQAGVPLPAINGPAGFSYCPDGQASAYTTGHDVADPQPGDVLIFSWEPWYLDGIAYCSYGVYAGAPAGDHTGFWAGPGVTVEGNTSQSSWDNGGAVMERHDRNAGQICCVARHEAMAGGGPTRPEEDEMTEADFARIQQIVFDTVLNLWREAEMANLDAARAETGSHRSVLDIVRSDEYANIVEQQAADAGLGIMRSDENTQIIERACRRALG